MYTSKYINQLATMYTWPTILAGGSKIVDNCGRGTPGVVSAVPF